MLGQKQKHWNNGSSPKLLAETHLKTRTSRTTPADHSQFLTWPNNLSPWVQSAHLCGGGIEGSGQEFDKQALKGDESGPPKHEQRAQNVQVVCDAARQGRGKGSDLQRVAGAPWSPTS